MTASAVSFATRSRIHVGLGVTDLSRSVEFYRILLDMEPTKTRPGYAKFEPAEPPVNLALNQSREARPTAGTHYGIQVKSTEEVQSTASRLQAAGLEVRVEEKVSCCHAVQDKAWVDDPDGNSWEVFVVLGDTERTSEPEGDGGPLCCTDSAC